MYTLTMRKLFLAQLLGEKTLHKALVYSRPPSLMPTKSFPKAVYQFSSHNPNRSSELRYPVRPGLIAECQLKPTQWGWTASHTGTCKGPVHLTSHWSKHMTSRTSQGEVSLSEDTLASSDIQAEMDPLHV